MNNKNIVIKHKWCLVVPLNKRGVILWNHLKENKKYIKYFDFYDVNYEYYNLLDIGGETYKNGVFIEDYEEYAVYPKDFQFIKKAIEKLNLDKNDIPTLFEAMELAEKSNTLIEFCL